MAVCTLSKRLKQSRADQFATLIGAGGTVALYDGPRPSSPDDPVPDGCTLIATLTGNRTSFAPPATSTGVNGLAGGLGGSGLQPAEGSLDLAFSGGGGSGAAAVAIVTSGVVVRLIITNPGSGYSTLPTVTFPANVGSLPTPPIASVGVVVAASPFEPAQAVAGGTPSWARVSSAASVAHMDLDAGPEAADVAFAISPATVSLGVTVTARAMLIAEG